MPLNETQRYTIKAATESFFSDLPKEEKNLSSAIDAFNQAFMKMLHHNHGLFLLQQCIHASEFFFQKLEKFGENTTVGEVQEYILEEISVAIEEAAKEIHQTALALGWEKEALQNHIQNRSEYKKLFISKPRPRENNYSEVYSVIHDSERMLSAGLVLNEQARRINLMIITKIRPEINNTIYLADFPENEEMLNDLINSLKKNLAKEKAIDTALQNIFTNLLQKNILTQDEKNKITREASLLLTYKIYHTIFTKNKESFSRIFQLTNTEIKILESPIVRNYISHERISLNDAIKLTQKEIFNLSFPSLLNFINLNKITVDQAKNTSVDSRAVISDEFYFQLIKDGKLNFNIMQNLDSESAKYLMNPGIKKLFSNPYICWFLSAGSLQIIDLQKISYREFNHYHFDLSDRKNDWLNLSYVKMIIDNFILLTSDHLLTDIELEYIYDNLDTLCSTLYIENNTTESKRSNLFYCGSQIFKNPLNLLSDIYLLETAKINLNTRLQALMDGRPIQLNKRTLDSFSHFVVTCKQVNFNFNKILHHEIEKRIYHALSTDDSNAIKEIISQKRNLNLTKSMLIKYLLNTIKKKIKTEFDRKKIAIFNEMLNEISAANQNDSFYKPMGITVCKDSGRENYWKNAFFKIKKIADEASEHKEDLPSVDHFFKKSTQEFCRHISTCSMVLLSS